MEPLLFGDREKPLFGVRHVAHGAPRRAAVLICPGWGMEYMRGYRGLRLLASRLAEAGFETLRFDYSGTGDSGGHALDVTLEHWLADIATAARELRELSGSGQLVVLGVRLGALLVEAAKTRGHLSVNWQLSWDAPASGADFVALMQKLGRANDAVKQSRRNRGMRLPPQGPEELHAFSWPDALDAGVRALPGVGGEGRQLWISSRDHEVPAPASAQRLDTGEASHWQDARWIGSPWVPAAAIQQLVTQLTALVP